MLVSAKASAPPQFEMAEIRTTYTISGKRNDQAGDRAELLISNWPLPGRQDGRVPADS